MKLQMVNEIDLVTKKIDLLTKRGQCYTQESRNFNAPPSVDADNRKKGALRNKYGAVAKFRDGAIFIP